MATAEAKKIKSAIDTATDEFICPITFGLPLDPVTAEDGRVYERAAIEDWFATKAEAEVKSPITNELMGKKLLPAVHIRNNIKALVQSGAISGDKANAWKKRLEEEKEVVEEQKRAERGDTIAMTTLAYWHRDGNKGLAKDRKKAFEWWKKAADLDHPPALASCGYYYVHDLGVAEKDVSRGLIMLGQAAALGSDFACYKLGYGYAHGKYGVKKDPAEAAKWYRRMVGCKYNNCTQQVLAKVSEWLREHDAGEVTA